MKYVLADQGFTIVEAQPAFTKGKTQFEAKKS